MNRTNYFDNLSQVIACFDDELMAELLVRIRSELNRRGKFDAGCYVGRARNCFVLETPSSSPTA